MANTTAPHEQFVPIEKLRCAERRIAELEAANRALTDALTLIFVETQFCNRGKARIAKDIAAEALGEKR